MECSVLFIEVRNGDGFACCLEGNVGDERLC